MSDKISKSLTPEKTDFEIENGCHSINFCSWNRLKPFLAKAAGCEEERVIGVRAIKEGVEIILS